MLSSVSMIMYLSLLFTSFISFSYSQQHTIDKSCAVGSATCGAGQTCVNNYCQCDPYDKKYWAGEKHGCRVCPNDFVRQPKRCYKYYKTAKNHSEARTDCRNKQADLFSWRDNTDEHELLAASTIESGVNNQVKQQFYAWSGGIVHHGRGSKAEYKITWFDPKGPTIGLPDLIDPLTNRFCNGMLIADYQGQSEPTRLTKNGERENCLSYVFVPQKDSRGHICIADDYCSTRMSYICEYTETSLSGIYETLPPLGTTTNAPSVGQGSTDGIPSVETTGEPSALGGDKESDSSNTLIYAIVGVLLLAIIGVVAYVIIRKRNQNNQAKHISPTTSMASSAVLNADMFENV